jgi:hypothetical protein
MTVTLSAASDADANVDQDGYSAPEQRFNRPDALCEFNRKTDSGVSTLRIDVQTMSDPAKQFGGFVARCKGTAIALRGIGNEAVQCVNQGDVGMGREQVIARVRERAFVLTVIRPPGASAEAPNGLRHDTRNIAEQVAGSIF